MLVTFLRRRKEEEIVEIHGLVNKAAMFVLVGCDCHLFLGQPCLFGVWKTHRGRLGVVSRWQPSWS